MDSSSVGTIGAPFTTWYSCTSRTPAGPSARMATGIPSSSAQLLVCAAEPGAIQPAAPKAPWSLVAVNAPVHSLISLSRESVLTNARSSSSSA